MGAKTSILTQFFLVAVMTTPSFGGFPATLMVVHEKETHVANQIVSMIGNLSDVCTHTGPVLDTADQVIERITTLVATMKLKCNAQSRALVFAVERDLIFPLDNVKQTTRHLDFLKRIGVKVCCNFIKNICDIFTCPDIIFLFYMVSPIPYVDDQFEECRSSTQVILFKLSNLQKLFSVYTPK